MRKKRIEANPIEDTIGNGDITAFSKLHSDDDITEEDWLALSPRMQRLDTDARFLGLPNSWLGDPNPNYCISMAPINSSGDIYHIISYVVLALSRNKEVPKVCLTYDIDANTSAKLGANTTTGDQVKRSLCFVKSLGLEEHFFTSRIDKGSGTRQTHRQKILHDALSKNASPIYYIDQMATTRFIANCVEQFGFDDTTQRIRKGYSHIAPYVPEPVVQKITEYVDSEAETIAGMLEAPNQPLVIVHARASSKANSGQDLPGSYINKLVEYIHSKHYACWVITADGRLARGATYNDGNMSAPFYGKMGTSFTSDQQDFAKLAHLHLLLRMAQMDNVVGVIGNTSGTLDLAAFIGLQVYNIHQSAKLDAITYQEYRLYVQLAFLTMGELVKQDKEWGLSKRSAPLNQWLQQPSPGRGKGVFEQRSDFDDVTRRKSQFGFCNLFYIRTWKTQQDTRNFDDDNITMADAKSKLYLLPLA